MKAAEIWSEGADAPAAPGTVQVGTSKAYDWKDVVYLRGVCRVRDDDMAAHVEDFTVAMRQLLGEIAKHPVAGARVHRAMQTDLYRVDPGDGSPPVLMLQISCAFVPSE